jgi:hypothetical protein
MVDARLRSSVNGFCAEVSNAVIACDKREAFAQGSSAMKQSILLSAAGRIASMRSQ